MGTIGGGLEGSSGKGGALMVALEKDMDGSSSIAIGNICVRAHFLIMDMLAKMLALGDCWTWNDAVVLIRVCSFQ